MARSTFKTLFYINRSKEKKNGKCPIMGRITIDGKQVQYSTGKEIAPELWDSRKGRCKGTGEEIKEINRYLQAKEEQAKAKYQELVWQRGYITAELLKCELMEEDKPKGFLLEEAHLFIEDKRPCVGVTIAKPTFANYIYATQLIEAYLRERLGLEDIRYSLLHRAAEEVYPYRSVCGLQGRTATPHKALSHYGGAPTSITNTHH